MINTEIDYLRIGKKIRDRRLKCRLSGEVLAKLVQISTQHMEQIEAGDKVLNFKTFIAIANELQISTDELLQGNLHLDTQSKGSVPKIHAYEIRA